MAGFNQLSKKKLIFSKKKIKIKIKKMQKNAKKCIKSEALGASVARI
jgi:hypothetical protein